MHSWHRVNGDTFAALKFQLMASSFVINIRYIYLIRENTKIQSTSA
jgi:hypothetical protein